MAQLTEVLAKNLLARYGLPIPQGCVVRSSDEAFAAAESMRTRVAVKGQVPIGGRGLAGAIECADTPQSAAAAFDRVTKVNVHGLQATTALIEPWIDVDHEMYIGVAIDSKLQAPVVLLGSNGGIGIETRDVDAEVIQVPLRNDGTLPVALLAERAAAVGIQRSVINKILKCAVILARAFVELDCLLIEVNPIGTLPDGEVIALDAHVVVDNHALHRRPEMRELIALSTPRSREDELREMSGLEYVRLGGELGLISGGAGLTMAVMDMVVDAGSSPACFLDCSGNPTRSGYATALHLVEDDSNARAILISLFGGGTQVDRVAKSLVSILDERWITKPVTIRVMGTNVEAADMVFVDAGYRNYRSLEEAVLAAVATLPSLDEQRTR